MSELVLCVNCKTPFIGVAYPNECPACHKDCLRIPYSKENEKRVNRGKA